MQLADVTRCVAVADCLSLIRPRAGGGCRHKMVADAVDAEDMTSA